MEDMPAYFRELPQVKLANAVRDVLNGKPVTGCVIPDLSELLTKLQEAAAGDPARLRARGISLRRCRVDSFVLQDAKIAFPIRIGWAMGEFERSEEEARQAVCAFPNGLTLIDVQFDYAPMWFGNFFERVFCQRVDFKAGAYLNRNKFLQGASFSECTFRGTADFSEDDFLWASFSKTEFLEEARFERTTCEKELKFGRAIFSKPVYFARAVLGGLALLADRSYPDPNRRFPGRVLQDLFLQPPVFRDQGRLHLGDSPEGFAKFADRPSGEAAFRTAKNHAQLAGEYLLAGDYHYAERLYRSRRRKWYNPLRWLENIFVRGVFGYGERES